jgi:cupin 2 domain-containing protein
MTKGNIFDLGQKEFDPLRETFETLFSGTSVRAEKIISKGHVTEPGKWYDQHMDEWVILLQGKASLEFENNCIMDLKAGDFILIPSGKKHRVAFTSKKPTCIWLAVHGRLCNSDS